jgi:hypothetical protein
VPYQSLAKPGSSIIPRAPVKSQVRENTSTPILDTTYTTQGRHPIPRRHLSFHEDILDTSNGNLSRLFQENEHEQYTNETSPQIPQLPGISPIGKNSAPVQADNTVAKEQGKKDAAQGDNDVPYVAPAQTEKNGPPAQDVGNNALVQGAGALPLADADIDQTKGARPAANNTEITFSKGSKDLNISDTLIQQTLMQEATSTPLPASPGPIRVPEYLHKFLSQILLSWNDRFPYESDACLVPLITKDSQKYTINWDQATKSNISILMLWSDQQKGKKSREPSPKL